MTTRRDSRAPGPRWTEERSENHGIGGMDEVVVTVAFRGAAEDPRHLDLTTALIERLADRLRQPVRLLFVLPDAMDSKPPSEAVRQGVARSLQRVAARLARVSVVVAGDGFGPAVQRAIIAGFRPFIHAGYPLRVSGTVAEGIDYLVGPGLRGDELMRLYEDLTEGRAPSPKKSDRVAGG
jgi:hypothetical protein